MNAEVANFFTECTFFGEILSLEEIKFQKEVFGGLCGKDMVV